MNPEPTETRVAIEVRIAVRTVRAEEMAQDVRHVLIVGVVVLSSGLGVGFAGVRRLHVHHRRRVVFDELREVRQIGVGRH